MQKQMPFRIWLGPQKWDQKVDNNSNNNIIKIIWAISAGSSQGFWFLGHKNLRQSAGGNVKKSIVMSLVPY